MLPRINSASLTLHENNRHPEGWGESEVERMLVETIKDKIHIEYRDTDIQEATDIVAKIAVLSVEEYCQLMKHIEELENKVEFLEFALENSEEKLKEVN